MPTSKLGMKRRSLSLDRYNLPDYFVFQQGLNLQRVRLGSSIFHIYKAAVCTNSTGSIFHVGDFWIDLRPQIPVLQKFAPLQFIR